MSEALPLCLIIHVDFNNFTQPLDIERIALVISSVS